MQDIKLGKAGDLEVSTEISAVITAALMVIGLSALGYFVLHLPVILAVVGGLTATLLHYYSDLFHQQGHAAAARRVGYPMTGIVFWLIFSRSLYPPDEPELPPRTHITRALGGPIRSAVVTLVAGVALAIVTQISQPNSLEFYVFAFFFLDNLLIFTLGPFLPLGFTDGSTLLHWLPKRGKQD